MNGAPDAARYLVGGGPRSVIVPARVARLIDREIGAKRVANRGLDREITEVLEALHTAGLEYLEAAAAVNGRTEVPQIANPPVLSRGAGPQLLDSLAVAGMLGCGPRNVRDLRARGRLHGERVGGKWLFPTEVVEGFLADRDHIDSVRNQ